MPDVADPLLSADEPISPKKPKSVPEPEPGDVEGEATCPLPSEWTSVRISPGEGAAGQDVLAVRVLVTSDDDSSSDAELNCSSRSSEASSTEPCEERPQQPDHPPLREPLSRHSSLREPLSRAASAQGPEEPRALHGEQRACLPGDRLAGSRDRGKEQRAPRPVSPAEDPATGDTNRRLRGGGAGT
ncbi:hypothetical protein D623_10026883 [Myotis brandtii]|uniref:Uncharacterized protein n=1 Tax=Myotis brandtii TaxID=109478 RepID=S7N8M8_MYOBR|nr:hypothetical protein D623_10026883 [Myotis brandtii]